MGSPNLTEAIIEFQFEIDDTPIKKLNEVMDQFRENQLKSNASLQKALEQMNKKGIKNTISGYARVRKELKTHLKQERNEYKQHGTWLKGIQDKYKTNVTNVNQKLTKTVKTSAKQQATAVKRAYADIEVNVSKALAGVGKSFSKQTRNASKEAKKLGKDFSKISGMFKLDINTSEIDKPIDDMRTMMANLKAVGTKGSADFNAAITRGYRMMSSNSVAEIKQGQQLIENTLKRNYTNQLGLLRDNTKQQMSLILRNKKEQIAAHKSTMERLLSNDKLSDSKRLQIEKQFQSKMKAIKSAANRQGILLNQQRNSTEVKMAQQHSRRMSAVSRTSGTQQRIMPNRRVTGFLQNTPIFGEMTSAAQGLTARLGPLGSALGKLGPIGIGVAAILGTTAVLFAKSAAAAGKYHDGLARIGTLLDDTQMEELPASMDKVRSTALSTGKSIENLTTTFYNVISAVPSLGSNLNAVSSIVDKAAKTAVALGAETDEIALAMTNLGNAAGMSLDDLGNQDKILDVLANTMKQGVIPSASVLASNIAKNAPLFSALNANIGDTVNVLGAATALFTASGVSMEETQTQMKAFATELIDVNKQAELVEAGIEGINPEGQVEDWNKLTDSIVANMDDVMQIFTSSEAKNAVRILAKEGGDAFKDLILSMETAGGTSDAMFARMAGTSQMASDRLGVAWNDLMIQMGSGSESMVTGFKNGLTSLLNGVNELFSTSEQQMESSLGKGKEYIDLSTDLKGVSVILEEALTAGDKDTTSKAFAIIEEKARDIEKMLPGMADEINAILEGDGDAAEKMKQLGVALENVERVVALMGKIEIGEGIQAGKDQLNDIAGSYDGLLEDQQKFKDRQDELNNVMTLGAKIEAGQVLTMKERSNLADMMSQARISNFESINNFRKEGMFQEQRSQLVSELILEQEKERGNVTDRIAKNKLAIQRSELGTAKLVDKITKGILDQAKADTEILTKEELRFRVAKKLGGTGKESLKIQDQISDEIEIQLDNYDTILNKAQEELLIKTNMKGLTEATIGANLEALNVENAIVVEMLNQKGLLDQVLAAKMQIIVADMVRMVGEGKLTLELEKQMNLELEKLRAKRAMNKSDITAAAAAERLGKVTDKANDKKDDKKDDKKPPRVPRNRRAKEEKFSRSQVDSQIQTQLNAQKQAWEQAQREKKAIIQTENDQKKKELRRHREFMDASRKKFNEELKLIGERLDAELQFNRHLRDIAKQFQQQAIELAKQGTSQAKDALRVTKGELTREERIKAIEEIEKLKGKKLEERIETEKKAKTELITLEKQDRERRLEQPVKELKLRKAKQESGFGGDPGRSETLLMINRQEMDKVGANIADITFKAAQNIDKLEKELEQIELSAGLTLDISDFTTHANMVSETTKDVVVDIQAMMKAVKTPVSGETPEMIAAQMDMISKSYLDLRDSLGASQTDTGKIDDILQSITAKQHVLSELSDPLAGDSLLKAIMEPPKGEPAAHTIRNIELALEPMYDQLHKTFPLLAENLVKIGVVGGEAGEMLGKFQRAVDPATMEKLNSELDQQFVTFSKLKKEYKELQRPLAILQTGSIMSDPDIRGTVEADSETGGYKRRDWSKVLPPSVDMANLGASTKVIIDSLKEGVPLWESYRNLIKESNEQIKPLNKEVHDLLVPIKAEVDQMELMEILQNNVNELAENETEIRKKNKSIKDQDIELKHTEKKINEENLEIFSKRAVEVRAELEARKLLLESEIKFGSLTGDAAEKAKVEIQIIKNQLANELLQVETETFTVIRDGKEVELERLVVTQEAYDLALEKAKLDKEAQKANESKGESDKKSGESSKQAWEEELELSEGLFKQLKEIQGKKEEIQQGNKEVIDKKTGEVDVEATKKKEAEAQEDINKLDKKSLDTKVKIMKIMEGISDLTFEIAGSFDEIQNTFREGGGGAAVEQLGDLTKKIGMGLLNSGISSLQTAGAVLLGAGMIAKLAGRIASLFIKPEESRSQQAEKYVAAQERLLAIFDAQQEKMDNLAKSGDNALDTAYERLAVEKDLLATLLAQTGQSDQTQLGAIALLDKMKRDIIEVDAALKGMDVAASLESGSDAYHDELRKVFGSGGVFEGEAEDILGDAYSDIYDPVTGEGRNITDSDFDDAMILIQARLDELGIDATTQQEIVDGFQALIDGAAAARKEFEELMALRVDMIVDLGLTNEEIVTAAESVTDKYRDALNEKLEEIAPEIDWASLDADEMKQAFIDLDMGDLGEDELELFNEWVDSVNNLEESLDALLNKQMALNTARTKINPEDVDYLTQEEALEANLALVRETLATTEEGTTSEEYILDLKAQEYALEQELLNLGKEGNDVLSEKIRLLHEQRQEAIARIREGKEQSGDRALIDTISQQILDEMKAGGASDAEIEATKQAFEAASYEKGTDYIPNNELAYLHQGEAVLNKADNLALSQLQQSIALNNDYIRGILDNYSASNMRNQPLGMDYFGDAGKMGDTIVNLTVNISGNVDNPEETGRIIYETFEDMHKKSHINSGSYNGRA